MCQEKNDVKYKFIPFSGEICYNQISERVRETFSISSTNFEVYFTERFFRQVSEKMGEFENI